MNEHDYDLLNPLDCQAVWDAVYSVGDPQELPWESDIPSQPIEMFVREVTKRCDDKESLRVLDFGCGTGRLGRYIEEKYFNYTYNEETYNFSGKVYYYDISEKALEFCRTIHNIQEDRLIHPDINQETFFKSLSKHKVIDRFDGIIMWGVLHHLNKDMQNSILKLIKKILKPNGVLLVADFNANDVLYNNTIERISEITGRKTYAINFNSLLGQYFNIIRTDYFFFKEKQKILEQKVKSEQGKRLNQTRKISYALVEFSLLGRLKETVIKGFDSSDFAHFIEYKFLSSLNLPENSTSEYYANVPETSKKMWLLSMGLLDAYDKYKNEGKALINSSFSSMLFRKTLKRNSFIVTSRIDSSNNEIQIKLSHYDNDLFVNLYEICMIVPRDLKTCAFEKKYQEIKRNKYTWNYDIPHMDENDNSYHRSAINQLNCLKSEGFSLFDEKELSIVFSQIDSKLDVFLKEHSELQDLRQAILMILLFVYPIDSESSGSTLSNEIEKTYLALVPPAFANPIMKDSQRSCKEISAGGAILYSMGDPFQGVYEKKRKFLWDVMKWSSALTAKEVAEFTVKESEKSAKAAIMSRNMSHNIGSHVMSYLKQHLSSVTNIINDNVLAEMIMSNSAKDEIQYDTPLPFLVGMGHFLSYIQERQDFIATIATDYIPYFSTVNFKDFVYDELNPDKRFNRHKDRKNLQPDNIMLGNIARSEGLGREIQTTSKRSGQLSDIVLNFRDAQGHIFDGEPVVNSSNVIIAGREDASKALEAMRTLEVNLPGGVIGRQAIFSIVENIIRNAAKHGNWREHGKLELTFEFVDKKKIEEFALLKQRESKYKNKESELNDMEKTDYDSIKKELEERSIDAASIETAHPWGRDKHLSLMEVLWLFYSQSLDADDLYFVTITDNITISESAVYKLREAIIESYVDNESKMKEGNKGIKEIRISAAWLRGAKNEDDYFKEPHNQRPQTEKKAPLLYVRQHNGCLQYIICLQKPRNVAVVTQKPLAEAAMSALNIINWRYYSPEEYIKERNKSYRFTVCENDDIYYMIRPFSSSRVYVPNSESFWESIKNGLSESDSKVYEKELYQSFVKDNSTIWIDDDKATGEMVTIINEDTNYATQEDGGYYKVNDVDVRVIDGCHSHVDYIYRKHHDTLNQFTSFMADNPDGCLFVESITGDTSTDRLVRNEKYDFRWYFSHLNAMRKKVAVFDERIFSRIYGLEEGDFTKGDSADLEALKDAYSEQTPIYKRQIMRCETIDDLNKFVNENNLPVIEITKNDVYTKDYIALTYYQKGVSLYTLIKDDEVMPVVKKSFGVYGLFFEGENSSLPKYNDKYACRCERIATIAWVDKSLKVDFISSSESNTKGKFDFISIHQGLLDKLYEAFGIKYCKEEKIQLTTKLYEEFGKKREDTPYQWGSGFVPGLIVHSGRSKPSEIDMPQLLPFIQYASIEHAVLDCKYSLIDLLESARYEE